MYYGSKKQGRWYPDVNKLGMFQKPSYIYEDKSGNCWATGPTDLEVALGGVAVAIVLAILSLF